MYEVTVPHMYAYMHLWHCRCSLTKDKSRQKQLSLWCIQKKFCVTPTWTEWQISAVLTYGKVLDCWSDLHHSPRRLVPQHHRCCDHVVPYPSVLPVVNIWSADSNWVHLEQNIWVQNMTHKTESSTDQSGGLHIASPCHRETRQTNMFPDLWNAEQIKLNVGHD